MPPIPDIVRDSELETEFESGCICHVYYDSSSEAMRPVRTKEYWQIGKTIGAGNFGQVRLEHRIKGSLGPEVRAVKRIRKSMRSVREVNYDSEIEAIVKFSAPKYVRCFVESYGWFETSDYLHITMEYIPFGDLHDYISNNPPIPEFEVQQIMFQLLEGIDFMHENDCAHRDLKPANILIKSKAPHWWVKIGDFGLSKRAMEAAGGSLTRGIGTDGFMAPEISGFLSPNRIPQPLSPYPADIWSLGETCHKALTKKAAFENPWKLHEYISSENDFPSINLQERQVSSTVVEFISACMKVDPRVRLTAQQARCHKWIQLPITTVSNLIHTETMRNFDIQKLSRELTSEDSNGASALWSRDTSVDIYPTPSPQTPIRIPQLPIQDSPVVPRPSQQYNHDMIATSTPSLKFSHSPHPRRTTSGPVLRDKISEPVPHIQPLTIEANGSSNRQRGLNISTSYQEYHHTSVASDIPSLDVFPVPDPERSADNICKKQRKPEEELSKSTSAIMDFMPYTSEGSHTYRGPRIKELDEEDNQVGQPRNRTSSSDIKKLVPYVNSPPSSEIGFVDVQINSVDRACAFSIDKGWLAIGKSFHSYSTFQIRDWKKGKMIYDRPWIVRVKSGYARAMTFSPDSWILALALYDRIELYKTKTWTRIKILDFCKCRYLQFSPDGHILACVSDSYIVFWEVYSPNVESHRTPFWKIVRPMQLQIFASDSVAFTRDGKMAAWFQSYTSIEFHSLETRQPIPAIGNTTKAVRYSDMAFSPKENLLVVTFDNSGYGIEIWDYKAQELVKGCGPPFIEYVTFRSDGEVFATMLSFRSGKYGDKTIHLWNVEGVCLAVLDTMGSEACSRPLFSSDERRLAVMARRSLFSRTHYIRIWSFIRGWGVKQDIGQGADISVQHF